MSTRNQDKALKAWGTYASQRLAPVDRVARNRASTPTALAEARGVALAEVNAALAAVATARVSMNSLKPACRLPSDVVLEVLKWAQAINPPRYLPRPYLGWLILTQSCHHWRETAMDHASLWSAVELRLGPLWASAFRTRSRTNPLSICCTTPICHDMERSTFRRDAQHWTAARNNKACLLIQSAIIHVLQTAPEHIADLDLEAPAEHLRSILTRLFAHPEKLSRLVSFTVRSKDGLEIFRVPNASGFITSLTYVSLPDHLPGAIWKLFSSTLISITVTRGGGAMDAADARGYVLGLFDVLRRSKQLKHLSLSFERLPSWSGVTENQRPKLHQLVTLSIFGDAKVCLDAIHSLGSLRGLCKLDISVTGHDLETLHVTSFLPFARLVSDEHHSDRFTSLSLVVGNSPKAGDNSTGGPNISVLARRISSCSHACEHSALSRTHPDLSLKFETRKHPTNGEARTLLTNLLSIVDKSGVKDLHIYMPGMPMSCFRWDAVDWTNVFHDAQAVESLHIRGECANLIHSLSASRRAHEPSGQQKRELEPIRKAQEMVFPLLQSLLFENVDFNTGVRIPLHQMFVRLLTARQSFDGIPRRLDLRNCQLDRNQAQWWADIVLPRSRDWDAHSLICEVQSITVKPPVASRRSNPYLPWQSYELGSTSE